MLIDNLMLLEDEHQYEEYIRNSLEDDRIILIIGGQLTEKHVPQIHHLPQILSIYIYCSHEEKHEQWIKQYNKIRGVFTQSNKLIENILLNHNEQNYNTDRSISFDIFDANNINNGHSTSNLNGEFIHSQLLIDCLIRLKSNVNSNEKDEFLSFSKEYYKADETIVKNLQNLLEDYSKDKAIQCYTSGKRIFHVLNKALRNKEIDHLYYLRFFLRDMEEELKAISRESPTIHVYRSQKMSLHEIQKLKTSIGQFISITTFLSTSCNSLVAGMFLSNKSSSDGLECVIFEIEANSNLNNIKPFADISGKSWFPDEEEVLFMAGSIFRLNDVYLDDKIWHVKLQLSSHEDEQLKSLMDYMINEYESEEVNLFSFGNILRGMGKLHDAKNYYDRFLKEASDGHHDLAGCHHSLGIIADENGDYEQSLKHFQNSLEIDKQSLSDINHPNIALSYNSIAVVYTKKGDYQKALNFFNQALIVFKYVNGDDDLEVAGCYYNIGGVYQTTKEYLKAHDYYQNALSIRKKHLPENHLDIGESQCSIGNIHLLLDQLDLALECYYSALEIYKKSCSDQHSDIAIVLENLGLVYEQKGDWQHGLAYFQKAKNIYINMSLHQHPTMKKIEDGIIRISSKLN
ncbi:unnamed protein product [Adineta steineri]|uniref:NAD(P)(+)--arginine ADP-ribosyltransferase n=1 Tax=Adineta steineri TaxID=433720 RepID=A0A814GNN4_9BILA|nr:unnamed protein product [Adineta steineri]CAF1111451.1 unnamed protein product [Adineta steineri]